MFEELEQDLDECSDNYTEMGLLPASHMSHWYGNDLIEQELLDLINTDRLPHALVFAGPKGIGKSTMAYRVMRYLFKYGLEVAREQTQGLFSEDLHLVTPDSLHVHSDDKVFKLTASGSHPDMLLIEQPIDERTKKKKDYIDVQQARRVVPFLRMTASMSGWRIVLIDDADTMNRNAQNAILKILEEPPNKTLLILVTHRPGALVPTIRSRCRVIKFKAPDKKHFKTMLSLKDKSITSHDIDLLYAISSGSIGGAIELIDRGGLETIEEIFDLFSSWPKLNWPKIHKFAEKAKGRKGQETVLQVYQDIIIWIVQSLIKEKASELETNPALDIDVFKRMKAHYTLEQWVRICEKLIEHFELMHSANLDKRQAVFGAFSIFEVKDTI